MLWIPNQFNLVASEVHKSPEHCELRKPNAPNRLLTERIRPRKPNIPNLEIDFVSSTSFGIGSSVDNAGIGCGMDGLAGITSIIEFDVGASTPSSADGSGAEPFVGVIGSMVKPKILSANDDKTGSDAISSWSN